MKTQNTINAYLKRNYPNWEQDSRDFYSDIAWSILKAFKGSSLRYAYIDIGSTQRTDPNDIDNNIAILIINADCEDYDLTQATLKQALQQYRSEGIDAWNFIISMDTLIITMDMAY